MPQWFMMMDHQKERFAQLVSPGKKQNIFLTNIEFKVKFRKTSSVKLPTKRNYFNTGLIQFLDKSGERVSDLVFLTDCLP
jgi:hypothetical protein